MELCDSCFDAEKCKSCEPPVTMEGLLDYVADLEADGFDTEEVGVEELLRQMRAARS